MKLGLTSKSIDESSPSLALDSQCREAQNFLENYIQFIIRCELAGIGGLSAGPSAMNLLYNSSMLKAMGGFLEAKQAPAVLVQGIDSCGEGANSFVDIAFSPDKTKLLSPETRFTKDITKQEMTDYFKPQGFTVFDKEKSMPAATDLPAVIRMQVYRPPTTEEMKRQKNQWLLSHSYIFVATQVGKDGEIYGKVIQNYFGEYCCAAFLVAQEKQPIKLKDHFSLLETLCAEDKSLSPGKRAAAHKEAFNAEDTMAPQQLIYTKAVNFDPKIASKQLMARSAAVCRETRILSEISGVAIDPKVLPTVEKESKEIWLPSVSFLAVSMKAYEKYNKTFTFKDGCLREDDERLAKLKKEDKSLQLLSRFSIAKGSTWAPQGISKECLEKLQALEPYNPPVTATI